MDGFEILDAIELYIAAAGTLDVPTRARGRTGPTINELDEVEWSRVHLVLPERSAFLRDERPPSASVTISLPGPPRQIADPGRA